MIQRCRFENVCKELGAIPSMRHNIESLREKYRPKRVRVLFLAEAPPDKLENFFYYVGRKEPPSESLRPMLRKYLVKSGFNCFSNLYGEEFLKMFKELGFYLVDVIKCPVTKIDSGRKKRLAKLCLPNLIATLKELSPEVILLLGSTALEIMYYICREQCGKAKKGVMKAHGEVIPLEKPLLISPRTKYIIISAYLSRRNSRLDLRKPFVELKNLLRDIPC